MLCFVEKYICTENLKILECDQKSFKKIRYFEFIVVCKTLYIYICCNYLSRCPKLQYRTRVLGLVAKFHALICFPDYEYLKSDLQFEVMTKKALN